MVIKHGIFCNKKNIVALVFCCLRSKGSSVSVIISELAFRAVWNVISVQWDDINRLAARSTVHGTLTIGSALITMKHGYPKTKWTSVAGLTQDLSTSLAGLFSLCCFVPPTVSESSDRCMCRTSGTRSLAAPEAGLPGQLLPCRGF
jgi:hypothetical protein